MKKLLLKLTFTTLLLSVAYSQCDESNWEEYYPEMQGCVFAGAQSGDISGNGTLNITDIIMYIELIINAD